MRYALLSLAALGSALVIPEEQVLNDLAIESKKESKSIFDKLPSKDSIVTDIGSFLGHAKDASVNTLDNALSALHDAGANAYEEIYNAGVDVNSWIESGLRPEPPFDIFGGGERPPHHGGPGHRRPHHPPHHGKPNKTVYELIASSKYTTKLAKLIDEDEELVKILNGTAANYTVFAPTDYAFKKIPEHAPKPSKEMIKKVLLYHISPHFYPAGRVLKTHTIDTLLKSPELGEEPLPQRLSVGLGLKGLAVNFYSRIVAIDIFGTNGVIHGVDSIIIPPPKALKIISFLPSEFSTLELGLTKTGLLTELNETAHAGLTFFAPSNFAFQKLGPKINGFLFSKFGQKYLKALLKYHVVLNETLYSDAYYKDGEAKKLPCKGLFHADLPTLLDDKSLSVDVGRYGPFIGIRINGFARVAVQDGVAKDGVIHVVGDVLVPPKKLGGATESAEDMSVQELMTRLEPYVDNDELEL